MHRTSRDQKEPLFRVAIIGGGFAGAVLAAQLLRRGDGLVSIAMIDSGAVPGRGVAYGTQFDGHLLNVRAQGMSAYPEIPDHFLRWAQTNYDPGAQPADFIPRRVYGQYVSSLLQEESSFRPGLLQPIKDEAVSMVRVARSARIHLRSGRTIVADKVVLAVGNFSPSDPLLPGKTPESSRYVANPWSPHSLDSVNQDEDVLLIGSGLTALDVVLELRARGVTGTLHLVSRRGLLPQAHKATLPWPLFWNESCPRTVRRLLHLIRLEIDAAHEEGSGRRAVIDSLRPVTQKIWRSLPEPEQRRFLRHLRPYWDAHRHRVAPEIRAQIAIQLLSGEIRAHAGRVTAYAEDRLGVAVSYRERRSGKIKQLGVDRVINCTGPESDLRRVASPLLSDLMSKQFVCPDALSLGLKISENGSLVDGAGSTSDLLYTLGSTCKGTLWESTAVPEIRAQASELAILLLSELQRSGAISMPLKPATGVQLSL